MRRIAMRDFCKRISSNKTRIKTKDGIKVTRGYNL